MVVNDHNPIFGVPPPNAHIAFSPVFVRQPGIHMTQHNKSQRHSSQYPTFSVLKFDHIPPIATNLYQWQPLIPDSDATWPP